MNTTTRRVGRGFGGTTSRPVFLLVALSLIAGACNGDDAPGITATTAADTPTTAPTVDDGGPPLVIGDPVGLEAIVSLDEEGAIRTLVVAAEGATIDAVGPDGTAYRLVIPPDALLADTLITVTPLATVESEFVDGLVGGVDFAPAGLQFRVPATLEIVPTRDVPIERQVPFSYEGDRSSVGLGLIQPDRDRLLLWVHHFSGTGVLESTDARLEMNRRLAAHEGRVRDQMSHRMAELFVIERETGADVSAEAAAIWREFRNFVLQRIDYAKRLIADRNPGDLEYILDVMSDVLLQVRQAQLLGADDSLDPLLAELLAALAGLDLYQAMYDRCVLDHDFTVIPILIGMVRSQALLGHVDDEEEFECLRFTVRFESEVTVIDEEGGLITFPTTAELQLYLPLEASETLPLSYVRAEWPEPDQGPWCFTEVVEVTDGTLEVLTVRFDWEPENMAGGAPKFRADGRLVPPDDVVLVYDIGEAILRQRTIDGGGCTWNVPMIESDTLRQAWRALHAATEVPPYWYATEWEMLFDGDLVARKVYERQVTFESCIFDGLLCGEARAVERTTFELIHTPGG